MKRFVIAGLVVVVLAVVLIVTVSAGQTKITICHKGSNTITVAEPAAAAHFAHGDTQGPCPVSPKK
jgi:hypothetical protein